MLDLSGFEIKLDEDVDPTKLISVFLFICQPRLFTWSWCLIFHQRHLLRHYDDSWQFEAAVPDFMITDDLVITASTLRVLSENYDRCFALRQNFMRGAAASWTKDE